MLPDDIAVNLHDACKQAFRERLQFEFKSERLLKMVRDLEFIK